MPQARTLDGGLEVHTDAIAVADGAHAHDAAVLSRGTLGTRPCDMAPCGRPLPAHAPPLVFVCAAGPCGSGCARELTTNGQGCWVVAPARRPP
jgi:hypothetical protein